MSSKNILAGRRILVADGAMGTMLLDRIKSGGCLEELNLSAPALIQGLYADYAAAGADILETNTFGGNRLKLREFGLAKEIKKMNRTAVKLARQAAEKVSAKAGSGKTKRRILIAGSMGPSGQFVKPIGQYSFDEVCEALAEQAKILEAAGVDLIITETMADLAELKAAAIAVLQNTKLPLICSMTYGPGERTVTGTPALSQWVTLAALGVTGIGANCSDGPAELLPVVKIFSQARAQSASVRTCRGGLAAPLISVMPNAGRPELVNDKPVYPLKPEKFAPYIRQFLEAGANIIGSCCGSTPEHTKMIRQQVDAWLKGAGKKAGARTSAARPAKMFSAGSWLSSRLTALEIPAEGEVAVAGQRINPTARKELGQSLKQGQFQKIKQEAKDQVGQGAKLLDVNVAVGGLDEPKLMAEAVSQLGQTVDVPFILDSADPAALEAGLKNYPGKALINSVTAGEKSLKTVLPLAVKYGAAVIGLTMDEKGIPADAAGRRRLAKKIALAADKAGLPRRDIFIDPLVMTVASQPEAAVETLKALTAIKKELGVRTSLGVSNVSHGLPQRRLINRTYLIMAALAGVDLVIADPADSELFDLLKAAALLLGRDPQAKNYVAAIGPAAGAASAEQKGPGRPDEKPDEKLQRLVLEGDQESIVEAAQEALKFGFAAQQVIDKLADGMAEVGRRYDKNQIFLPQVMAAAGAMKAAFDGVKKDLPAESAGRNATALIATVAGDVHDIGKNIVAILLENSGFQVIDLGKNVPASEIVSAAVKYKPNLICLSALLTTTMQEMKVVKEQLKKKGLEIPILVGGAVITPEFADSIKAAYAPDALAAVRAADKLSRSQT